MAKEFRFHGKGVEELKKMNLDEFSRLLKSRQRRSLKRGFTDEEKKLIERIRKKPGKFHRTTSREMVIVPEMLGEKMGVHNGKEFVPVEINTQMLGHRLGEFAPTRKQVKHSAPGFGATRSSKFVPLK